MHEINEKKCPFCSASYVSACAFLEPYEEKIKEKLFKDKTARIKLLLGGITKGGH